MRKTYLRLILGLLSLLVIGSVYSQKDRIVEIEQHLKTLSENVAGLNQKVEVSISNGALHEFLKGLAVAHNLNFNIAPDINKRITAFFSNERMETVLVYLARQYDLDYSFTGNIISISNYIDPNSISRSGPKEISILFTPGTQTFTMDLKDDSLVTVAKKITQYSGRNIMVLPELYPKRISGYVQDMTAQNAIEKLAIANLFKVTKTNDNSFLLEALKPDEEIVAKSMIDPNSDFAIRKVNRNSGQSSSGTYNISLDSAGKKQITLNIVNLPIKDVIKNIAEQASINYFVYSDLLGNATATVYKLEFDKVLNYILQGTKYTFNVNNGVYMIGDRKDEGLRAHKLIQLKYRSVDSLLPAIPQELRQNVEIQEFKELNSFLLSGSQPQIKEIENFVTELDKTVPMVLIEVILMDVKKSKSIQTGITMGISDSVKTGGTLLGGPGTDFTFGSNDINRFIDQIGLNNVFNIGRVTPNFYVSLKALENNSNVELRQTPKLSALNGHTANLSIGSTRYYSVRTQNVIGSLTPQTVVTEQYIPVEASLAIDIEPFVSGDQQITLNINIDISDFLFNTPINVPPPSASSKFRSIIRVKNEEMIVLGGIERTEKSEEGSGTPFLSRIPLIKWLFSSRTKVDSKTVSVVFIKPTIIN